MSAQKINGDDKLNLEKISCLLVDDNEQSLEILTAVCAGFGMRSPSKAQSAEEARAALMRANFDLILTDANMPGESGYQLIEWLRREGPEPNRFIPAIVVTGHTRFKEVRRARDCGAQFTVVKPVVPKVLLERLFWVARDERPFIECDAYCGPDRRFKWDGPPAGIPGRRHDDPPSAAGEAGEPPTDQDGTHAMTHQTQAAS